MKYTHLQISFHWLSVALVLFMAATGLAFGFELGGKGVIAAHQIAGQTFLLLLVARIITRFLRPPQPVDLGHANWEKRLSGAVHLALYVILAVYVISGYVSASGLSNSSLAVPIDRAFARSDLGELILEVHYALKWPLAALVGLHIAGALKHVMIDHDATLSQMSFKSIK